MQIKPKHFLKRGLLTVIILAGGIAANAHNAVKFTQADTNETIIMLKEHPRVSMNDGFIRLVTDSDVVEYPLNESAIFEFIDFDDAGIGSISNDTVIFRIDQNNLEAFNLRSRSQVVVTDISGKPVIKAFTDDTGSVTIRISDLAPGIYVFNSIDKNFKFYKK